MKIMNALNDSVDQIYGLNDNPVVHQGHLNAQQQSLFVDRLVAERLKKRDQISGR
jgi:hypothetical protein